ncbi:TPA: hypothetical protein ACJJSH_001584, partial [Neisseria meningitidis]
VQPLLKCRLNHVSVQTAFLHPFMGIFRIRAVFGEKPASDGIAGQGLSEGGCPCSLAGGRKSMQGLLLI